MVGAGADAGEVGTFHESTVAQDVPSDAAGEDNVMAIRRNPARGRPC
jgi:hypothetical protein